MQESTFTNYYQLPLFLNVQASARRLDIEPFLGNFNLICRFIVGVIRNHQQDPFLVFNIQIKRQVLAGFLGLSREGFYPEINHTVNVRVGGYVGDILVVPNLDTCLLYTSPSPRDS